MHKPRAKRGKGAPSPSEGPLSESPLTASPRFPASPYTAAANSTLGLGLGLGLGPAAPGNSASGGSALSDLWAAVTFGTLGASGRGGGGSGAGPRNAQLARFLGGDRGARNSEGRDKGRDRDRDSHRDNDRGNDRDRERGTGRGNDRESNRERDTEGHPAPAPSAAAHPAAPSTMGGGGGGAVPPPRAHRGWRAPRPSLALLLALGVASLCAGLVTMARQGCLHLQLAPGTPHGTPSAHPQCWLLRDRRRTRGEDRFQFASDVGGTGGGEEQGQRKRLREGYRGGEEDGAGSGERGVGVGGGEGGEVRREEARSVEGRIMMGGAAPFGQGALESRAVPEPGEVRGVPREAPLAVAAMQPLEQQGGQEGGERVGRERRGRAASRRDRWGRARRRGRGGRARAAPSEGRGLAHPWPRPHTRQHSHPRTHLHQHPHQHQHQHQHTSAGADSNSSDFPGAIVDYPDSQAQDAHYDEPALFEAAMSTTAEPFILPTPKGPKGAPYGAPKGASQGSPEQYSSIPKYPKVAFLFLTRGPLPLAPVWERFLDSARDLLPPEEAGSGPVGTAAAPDGPPGRQLFSIYIHTAKEFRYEPGSVPRAFEGRRIPSEPIKWGGISMVDAERRLLAQALRDPLNQRFVLVSDSCLPLFNFTFVYRYLLGTPVSFLRGSNYRGYAGTGRWNRGFLPLVPVERWRKGNQWFALTRDAARRVVGDGEYYPVFKEHCRSCPRARCTPPSCYSDEHYIQTLLYAVQADASLANRSVTWIDWSRGGAHPMAFRAWEIGKGVLNKVRAQPHCEWNGEEKAYCYLFARKFRNDTLHAVLKWASYLGY